jgi:hypothetical protein
VSVPPWLVLALVAALALALMYQIATRQFGGRIVAYWGLMLVGFLGAEALADALGWNVTRFGDLRVAPDIGGALLAMSFLWFLRL